jgi:hypothetical protein
MGSGGGTADGGGGENNAGGNDESGVAESNTVGEGGMSENAIEADRNATVASSGMSMSSSDPDSSESLFGDAAYSDGGTTSASTSTPPYDDMGDGTVFSTTDSSRSSQSSSFNEFDTSSEFEEPKMDDGTTFSTHESSSSKEDEISPSADPEGGTSGGVISQLWDMFKDLTRDDDEED